MIPPISSLSPITHAIPTTATSATAPTAATGSSDGGSFSNAVTNAIDDLQQAQSTASSDEAQAAAGQGNLADTMIAASQASLDTEVTTQLLNQATTAYNAIVNMSF